MNNYTEKILEEKFDKKTAHSYKNFLTGQKNYFSTETFIQSNTELRVVGSIPSKSIFRFFHSIWWKMIILMMMLLMIIFTFIIYALRNCVWLGSSTGDSHKTTVIVFYITLIRINHIIGVALKNIFHFAEKNTWPVTIAFKTGETPLGYPDIHTTPSLPFNRFIKFVAGRAELHFTISSVRAYESFLHNQGDFEHQSGETWTPYIKNWNFHRNEIPYHTITTS